MINKFIAGALTRLLVIALGLGLVHFFLVERVLPEIYGSGPYWALYLFLVPASAIVVVVSALTYKMDKTAVGRTYFLLVFLKMFASVAFLSPWLFWRDEFSVPMVHQFFGLFFPLLFVEIKLVVGLLNSSLGEN